MSIFHSQKYGNRIEIKNHEKVTGVLSHADVRLGQQSGYYYFCQENSLRKQINSNNELSMSML